MSEPGDRFPYLRHMLGADRDRPAPQRLQRKRTKGSRLPPNARSVTRPGYYGNPYKIGGIYLVGPLLPFPLPSARVEEGPAGTDLKAVRCNDAATAVEWFRQYAPLALEPAKIELLRGLDLACWCPLVDDNGDPVPCHADVLLEMANG